MTWAMGIEGIWDQDYDLVLTTSMTDVAALRGLVRPLADVPIVSYFHENQFAYPIREQRPDARLLIQTIQSAAAANTLVFNSRFNRDTFIDGACAFIESMPDHHPLVREIFEQRSRVLPVPLENECFFEKLVPPTQRLVWNHRWEWDKAPERFFSALRVLKARRITPRVALVGQSFRQVPASIHEGIEEFKEQLDFVGFQPLANYREILQTSTHVVSTALHEFQGLAVAEACAAGCVPVVPDRLSYVEMFPESARYSSYPDDADREARALAEHLEAALKRPLIRPNLSHLSWQSLSSDYETMLNDALNSKR